MLGFYQHGKPNGRQDGWIHTEYLPAYAPELNPVEYLWGYWKQHELLKDWGELHEAAHRTLRRIRRRPRIIAAFWEQSQLPFDPRYIM